MARVICRECGAAFEPRRAREDAAFCRPVCRSAFNNRRFTRGAQLYDMMMLLRYQRGLAKARGIWALLCRMCQDWRAEDVEHRAGRPSWQPYEAIHDRLLPLRADVLTGTVSRTRIAMENTLAANSRR